MIKLFYWAPRMRSPLALWRESPSLPKHTGPEPHNREVTVHLPARLSIVWPLRFVAAVFLGLSVQWRKTDRAAAHAN